MVGASIPMTENVVLLTGVPRSGTTLMCSLLNDIPDCVALPEPIQLERHGDRMRAIGEIEEFLGDTRRRALAGEAVATKHRDGQIIDNFAAPPNSGGELRRVAVAHGPVVLDKPLSPDFTLFVKHPAEFTALADLLLERYRIWAIVRHPLAVLSAWQTVDMPVNRGHMPMAEAFSPALAALLAREPDCLKRQVHLLGWLMQTYARLLPERVILYEDLMARPKDVLSRLTGRVPEAVRPLAAVDPRQRYAHLEFRPLAQALLALTPVAEVFYPGFRDSLIPYLK